MTNSNWETTGIINNCLCGLDFGYTSHAGFYETRSYHQGGYNWSVRSLYYHNPNDQSIAPGIDIAVQAGGYPEGINNLGTQGFGLLAFDDRRPDRIGPIPGTGTYEGSLYSYHAIDGSNNGESDYEIGEWFISAELYSDRLDRPGLYCICTRYRVDNHGPLDRLGSLTNILS